MSDKTTRGIRVQVESYYDEERSSPQDNYYFFAYRVAISNVGQETAQLVSREWIIIDGNGDTQRVQGPGVVGEQPTLAPGEEFEYTSTTSINGS
jgi:ApaG protein